MTMVSPRAALGIAAGIFGTLFVGYCVYFDRQRRNDPDFKIKLKERRRAKKQKAMNRNATVFPDMTDQESVQNFFLREVQLGEELLGQGEFDEGITHLCNAVTICGSPKQILEILQQTLPPNLYLTLLEKLPEHGKRISQQVLANSGGGGGNIMVEEDVE